MYETSVFSWYVSSSLLSFSLLGSFFVSLFKVSFFYLDAVAHLLGPFARPELQYLYENEFLPAHKFKVHFEYCCGNSSADTLEERVKNFKKNWLGAAKYYLKEWTGRWVNDYLESIKGEYCSELFCIAS